MVGITRTGRETETERVVRRRRNITGRSITDPCIHSSSNKQPYRTESRTYTYRRFDRVVRRQETERERDLKVLFDDDNEGTDDKEEEEFVPYPNPAHAYRTPHTHRSTYRRRPQQQPYRTVLYPAHTPIHVPTKTATATLPYRTVLYPAHAPIHVPTNTPTARIPASDSTVPATTTTTAPRW